MTEFKTASELGIAPWVRDGLVDILGRLDRGEVKHVDFDKEADYLPTAAEYSKFFNKMNMMSWCRITACGTVHCIGGAIEAIAKRRINSTDETDDLHELFYPPAKIGEYNNITLGQMTEAIRSYLTTGKVTWDFAEAKTGS